MLTERVPARRRVQEKPRLKHPKDYPSASNSPFDPIDIGDLPTEVRQTLIRRGILHSGLGGLPIPRFSLGRRDE